MPMPPAADVAGRQPTPPNLSTPPTPSPPDAAREKPAAGQLQIIDPDQMHKLQHADNWLDDTSWQYSIKK
jgi:hypothetical protein